MNLDILDQNLIIFICMIFSGLGFYIVYTLYKSGPAVKLTKKKDKQAYAKKNRIVFGTAFVLSLLFAVGLLFLCNSIFGPGLPHSFVFMCLPFTVSVCLLVIALIFKKKLRLYATGCLVLAVILSLMMINDYYRYDPTLGYVFGITNAQNFHNDANVTIHYTVSNEQSRLNQNSVQESLANLSSGSKEGTVYNLSIPGTVSHFNARPGYVYVPAAYDSSAQINLPVIVLTAGIPGVPANWLGAGLQNVMNQFAASHDGITPLVFMVDNLGSIVNDTECVNSPRGNVETYLTVDVPNYIKSNFRVDSPPTHWAIGGLSLGGMCALMLSLRHQNIYSNFIDLGGEAGPEVGSKQDTINKLFGGSESAWAAHQPELLLASHQYKGMGGFFGDGNQDDVSVTTAQNQLITDSKKSGIQVVSETIIGAHTFNVWTETFKDALPWISNRIGATECTGSCI